MKENKKIIDDTYTFSKKEYIDALMEFCIFTQKYVNMHKDEFSSGSIDYEKMKSICEEYLDYSGKMKQEMNDIQSKMEQLLSKEDPESKMAAIDLACNYMKKIITNKI